MPSLIDLRRRVRSVKNTQQITKAMKMVSAARLRRAQERALAARPYAKMLTEMLSNVAAAASQSPDANENRLLDVRPEKRILVVAIAADRGLAGGFNANLLKLAQRFIDDHPNAEISIVAVGKKSRDYFRRRNRTIYGEHVDLFRNVKLEDSDRIAHSVIEAFERAEFDSVYLFVNEFKNVMASHLHSVRLLPIEVPKSAETVDYIYEQKPEELLGSLLPRYIKLQIYRSLLESSASEHAARMTAMDAASRNAAEVIDKLTLYMNRVRQASITKEIIEVVSGSAALE